MVKRTLAISVFATITAMSAATRVTYNDLPGSSIQLLPGASEGFANALTAFGGSDVVPLLNAILPYSVIVHNQSPITVRHVVIRLDVKDVSGNTVWHEASLIARIAPGEMALITPIGGLNIPMRKGIVGSPPLQNSPDLTSELVRRSQQYEAQSEVIVSIDSVVFEDGTIIGPDTLHNLERTNIWRDADRSVVTELLESKPEQRITYLQNILDVPLKPARTPEEVDQFAFRRRSTAELMQLYISAFPDEAALTLALHQFLQQTPQLHRRIK